MYYDIVGSLPINLLIHVVKHLDLEDVFRSQRVSRRWHTVLSGDEVIAYILRETLDFLGLHSDEVSVDIAMADAMRYFRWRHGLEHARPVKKIFLPWSIYFPGIPNEIQYNSRRLCYTLYSREVVKMVNLFENGETSSWTGSGIRNALHLCLSDCFLVLLWKDSGALQSFIHPVLCLTAWNLRTKQRLDRRIPAFDARFMIVENKVVIAPSLQSRPNAVYVWELSSNDFKAIGKFSNLLLSHMDATDNILVAFEIWSTLSSSPPIVQQTKWKTTTEQLLDKKIFILPGPANHIPLNQFDWGRNSWNTFGHRTVVQSEASWIGKYNGVLYLEYDQAIDQLSVQRIDRAELVNKSGRSTFLTPNLVYRCNSETMELVAYNTTTGAATLRSIDKQLEREELLSRDNVLEFNLFGDREVFGFAVKTGIQLWFFNPSFTPDIIPTRESSPPDVNE